VLPNMNFTNTQIKTADTYYILLLSVGKYPIPQKTCKAYLILCTM